MSIMRTSLLAIAALSLATSSIHAQQSAGTENADDLDRAKKDLGLITLQSDPTFSSPPVRPDSGVDVKLEEEDSSAKVSVAFRARSSTWLLTAEAPIDDTTKRSDAIDLDGFSDATSLGLDYTWYSTKSVKIGDSESFHKAKLSACEGYFKQLSADRQLEIVRETKEKAEELGFTADAIRLGATIGLSELQVLIETRCRDDQLYGELLRSVRKVDPNLRWVQNLREAVLSKRIVPMFSVGAKIGVNDYDFVTLDTSAESGVAKDMAREEPWSARASAGVLWGNGVRRDKVFWLTYQRSTSFADADPAEICSAIPESELQRCEDQPLGAPTETDQDLLIGEFRTILGKAGLVFKAFHDFEDDKLGARAEFYFLKKDDGALTGGVGFEWQDGEGVKGSVFLTKGFDFGPEL